MALFNKIVALVLGNAFIENTISEIALQTD